MNVQPNISISLPASYIKAPGTLLKDKKDPREVKTNTKLIQDVLRNVEKANMDLTTQYAPTHGSRRYDIPKQSKSFEANVFAGEVLDVLPSDESLNFDTINDDTYMAIMKISRKVLSTYGIELVIDVSYKYYELVCEVLKLLVSDVCSFHLQFFKKIQLKQLVLSKRENSKNSCSKKNVMLIDELIHGKTKIYEAFYRIIFHHLALSKPGLIDEWKETEKREENSPKTFLDFICRIEESFMVSFMGVNDNGLLKPKIQRLQELLVKYYPEEISLEWFSNRIKERKKALKVTFLV